MFRVNFRIGTKLALAGSVALLTVGAIAMNQSWDRQARAELTAEADNVDAVRTATLTATVATRRVVIMGRDVRLAATAAEVDEALKKADAFTAAGVKAIDAAAAAAATAQSRQRFAHAKDVTGKYLAAIHELAAARKEILKSGGPMVAVLKDSADPMRVELDKILDEATADFNAQDAEIQGRIGAEQIRSRMVGLMLDAVVAMIIIGTIVFSFLGVSRPIARLNDAMEKMAKGDLDIDVPGAGRGDEIGDMAKTITVIRENAARAAIEKQEEAKREEAGRAGRRKANTQKLADQFENAVGDIVATVSQASTELEASAGTLTKSAETTQKLTHIVAEASEEASANVQSVASATEEMTTSITEISRQVQESSRIAGDAVKQAEKTDARITALSEAAGRIGDVVKLITAIAEQTNLLALNATIEAARAGEAGKGFAVVAQEVKALASQTAKATDEIGTQIKGMQSATQDSVSAIKEIGGTIGRISEIAAGIAAAVEQQGAATQEIARNVQQAAQGTTRVAANITDVNRGAAETGAASTQVLASAQSLANESSRLKNEMVNFLATVRAG